MSLSLRAVVIILWLAVVNTAFAFTLWNFSLRHLGAGESAVINNTMLLQIALLGWIFLDEIPDRGAVARARHRVRRHRPRPSGAAAARLRFVRWPPMDGSEKDEQTRWSSAMEAAIEQARSALDHGDVPVGAVVQRDGAIIAARHNERELTGDPSAHAEMLAIRDAAAVVGRWRLDDCTLVVTLEPCPMCAGAMVNARIGQLVYGATDPKAGAAGSLMNLVADPRLNHRLPDRQRRRGRSLRRPVGRVLRRPPPLISPVASLDGRMPERTNGTASKAVEVFGPPWVRIPLLPPSGPRRTTCFRVAKRRWQFSDRRARVL